jgi:integrase
MKPIITSGNIERFLIASSVRKSSARVYRAVLDKYRRAITTNGKVDETEYAVHEYLNGYDNPRTHNFSLTVINSFRKHAGLPVVKRRRQTISRHEFNTERIRDAVPRMIAACTTLRDRFLIIALRYSGLRVGEVTRLKKEHVSFPNGQLLINVPDRNTKTGYRPVLAWKASRDAREYLPSVPDGGWVFPAAAGVHRRDGWVVPAARYPSRRCTPAAAQLVFARLSKAAGYHVTPHDLRRLWETEMAGQYGVAILKDYFGQKSAEIVDIYIDVALGQSKTAIMGDLGFEKKTGLFSKATCWRCGTENDVSTKECRACHESLDVDMIPHKKEIEAMAEPELKDYVRKLAIKFGVL